jgi:cysteine desulfurase
MISAGSACTTQNVEPSHVLLALGLSEDQSHYAIRIGCGRFNTDEDIETATGEILNALKHLSRIHM